MEVLLVAGIFAVVVLVIAAFNSQLFTSQNNASSLVQLNLFQNNLVTLVKTKVAWDRTIAMNPSMSCLSTRTNCVAGGAPLTDRPFAIYDGTPGGTPFYDASSPQNGLTQMATACTGFNASNALCIFRYDLKWSAICTPPNCTDPQVKVSGRLILANGVKGVVVNTENYSVPEIYRTAR